MYLKEMTIVEVRDMYENYLTEAFPPDELRPLSMIEEAIRENRSVCYGYYEYGQLCTYTSFMYLESEKGRDYLGDFFASRKDMRNRGLGTKFLAEYPTTLKDPCSVIFEIENPDFAENEEQRELRERRRQFYLRNNIIDTGVNIQLAGVEYRIMEMLLGKPHTQDEIRDLYVRQYRAMLPPELFERFFHLEGVENTEDTPI